MEHYDVPAADIELLPNGYNPAEFNPVRKSELRALARAERGYRDDDRVLVFVANELERKGFFPLAEAMAAMKDPSLKLLVVGRVSLAPHLPLLRRLGIEKQVYCHGPSADVARLYAAADLFVLPTYYEAWGLVIVEALATGLPVLTSRLAGAAVAVQEGETGELLDDPRDPAEIRTRLEKMLASDPIPPESIAKTVERFRWSVVLQRYEEILAEQCA
jgi:UDP-glucose:(heptosyl)LPS alpha-1,3-glucosyltransferase